MTHTASRATPDPGALAAADAAEPKFKIKTEGAFPITVIVNPFSAHHGARGFVSIHVCGHDRAGRTILNSVLAHLTVAEAREIASGLLQAARRVSDSQRALAEAERAVAPTLAEAKTDYYGLTPEDWTAATHFGASA